MTRGLLVFVVVPALCLIALLRPRFASAAGVLTVFGAWFVYLWYSDRQRCLDMGPSCQFGDNTSTQVLAWVLLLGGLALTGVVARDARVSRSG